MADLKSLHIKLFADSADQASIALLAANPLIRGFTTNPTLMRNSGVRDYARFAREVQALVAPRPISFEVFSDDWDEMEVQAREIASWGDNVYVKIPITTTTGDFSGPLVGRLTRAGVKVNVTAMFTTTQVEQLIPYIEPSVPCCISIFAGRIADTGVDPVPLVAQCLEIMKERPLAELIWASPREILNVFQADAVGAHIITVTPDLLAKLKLVGKDLAEYSLETVQMFTRDAALAGFTLDVSRPVG